MKLHLRLVKKSKLPRWVRRIFSPYLLGYEEGLADMQEMLMAGIEEGVEWED